MKRIPKTFYLTPDEIDARIKAREAEAATLQPGEPQRQLLREIAPLRMYVAAKRWLEAPGVERRVKQNAS